MDSGDDLYGRIRNGVLTISGSNPSIKVENGLLVVRDGPRPIPDDLRGPAPPLEERMTTLRLPRAGCPVKSIVVIRPDGFITFAAIEWLHEVGVSLAHIDWRGEVLLANAAARPDRPALRRAQALAAGDETGLAIMREILRHKLAGQAAVARLLGGEDAALLIERLAGEATAATAGIHALAMEAAAASAYWSLWGDVRARFARRDNVPEHWQVFGTRRSVRAMPESRSGVRASNRSRKATSAAGAMLNYLYGLAASQVAIALAEVGLDPGIGIFHSDRDGRPSLAYDAIEAVRPYVNAWLLTLFAEVRFAKRDFAEEGDGTIRISRPLTSWLAMTAPLWRRAADAVAGWLAASLAACARFAGNGAATDAVIEAPELGEAIPAQHPKASGGGGAFSKLPVWEPPLPSLPAPGRAYKPALAHEVMPRACHECGRALAAAEQASKVRKFCSASCVGVYRAEMRRFLPLDEGRVSKGAIAAVRAVEVARSEKLRAHAAGRAAWDEVKPDAAADAALRRWYTAEVVPQLCGVARTEIARTIGVSRVYARDLARGKVPHARHFEALAALVGVAAPKETAAPDRWIAPV